MTRILLFSGSQRRDSYNARLLRHLAHQMQGGYEIDTLEAHQVRLPLFDQDLETSPAVIDHVAQLHARFLNCDAIIVASPEYNGQLTPYLKNVVDWVSRLAHIDKRFDNPFRDRPVLLCSASTGWGGGAVGIPHARALFGHVGCLVFGNSICVSQAEAAWTGDGYDFDPFFEEHAFRTVGRFLPLARAFHAARSGPAESPDAAMAGTNPSRDFTHGSPAVA